MAIETQDIPEPPKKGMHLLGGSKSVIPDVSGLKSDINSIGMRIRLLEEATKNIRRMSMITEENLILKSREMNSEFKTISSDINELRKEVFEIRDKILTIIRELQITAKTDDVKVLEKYLNLWNPIKFATHDEVDRIVSEALEKREQDKKGQPESNK